MSMTPDSRPGGLPVGAAPRWRRLGAGVVMAAAFALSACGGEGDGAQDVAISDTAAGGGQPGAAGSSGLTSAGQTSGGAGATATLGAPLDSSGWLLQPPFYAAGDEPYWRLEVIDGWFVFRRSGLPEIEAPMAQPTRVGDTEVFEAPPLTFSVKRGACSIDDGGASEFTAVVTFDESDYGGCAYGGAVDSSGSDESDRVARSLPAIDACLARLAEPAIVTAIYPREGGRTAVGLRTRNGSLFECGAEEAGEIAFLDPIEPGAAAAWMTSRMRFLRDGVAPEAVCDDAEIVRSGDQQVGLLLTSRCRF